MTVPIRHEWTDAGAPVLNNAAGSKLAVLLAVLVTGYNVNGIVNIIVADEVATVSHGASHGYTTAKGKLVRVSGSAVSALNGDKQPLSTTSSTWTFAAPGVADGTYTGTMEARRAPLDWAMIHNNVGVTTGIFARTALEASAHMLRVNDSGADGASSTNARVVMIESATDVDTYSGVSPQQANLAGGQYWYKGANNATAKPWAIVGDHLFFWFLHPAGSGSAPYNTQISYFGNPLPFVTPAPYDCLLCGAVEASSGSGLRGGAVNGYTSVAESYAEVIGRGLDLVTLGVRIGKHGPGPSVIGAFNQGQLASTPVVIHRPVLYSANDLAVATGRFRGEIPGLALPLARVPFEPRGQFAEVEADEGDIRTYLSVLFTIGSDQKGNLLIDLSGPWR